MDGLADLPREASLQERFHGVISAQGLSTFCRGNSPFRCSLSSMRVQYGLAACSPYERVLVAFQQQCNIKQNDNKSKVLLSFY